MFGAFLAGHEGEFQNFFASFAVIFFILSIHFSDVMRKPVRRSSVPQAGIRVVSSR